MAGEIHIEGKTDLSQLLCNNKDPIGLVNTRRCDQYKIGNPCYT